MAGVTGGAYGIYGSFGSGKTIFATKKIMKDIEDPDTIVFTNIKTYISQPGKIDFRKSFQKIMSNDSKKEEKTENNEENSLVKQEYAPNIFYFETYDEFQQLLLVIRIIVDSFNQEGINRFKRLKFKLYFDECGVFFSSADYKKHGSKYTEPILQCRKLGLSLFFIIQRPNRLLKEFRDIIDYRYTFKPLFGMKSLRGYVGTYRIQELETENGGIEIVSHKELKTLIDGTEIERTIYHEEKYCWIYKPYYYDKYDDLHLNQRAVEYPDINSPIVESTFTYLEGMGRPYINKLIDHVRTLESNQPKDV